MSKMSERFAAWVLVRWRAWVFWLVVLVVGGPCLAVLAVGIALERVGLGLQWIVADERALWRWVSKRIGKLEAWSR